MTLAEQGPQDPVFVQQVLQHALRGFIPQTTSGIPRNKPKTLLLGCTHFPVFKPALHKLLPSDTHIVDSAATTAADVAEQLTALDLLNTQAEGGCFYFATDGVARFKQVGSYFLGDHIETVELIDL